ncbi:NUDIX hydrolase [Pseudomonas borbori]
MSTAEVLASVDIVALRMNDRSQLDILLIRRAQAPFAQQWALPGVLVNGLTADASLDAAATRALAVKARIKPRYMEQVATVGDAVRDPRGWSLSTFYLALVAPDTPLGDEDLSFVALNAVLDRRFALPFDHAQLVALACERLAAKSTYTSLPLYLISQRFTVTEALAAFQVCLGQAVQHTTLRGRLERMKQHGWIVETGEKNYPKMGRPQNVLEHRPQPSAAFVFDRSVLS